MGKLVLPVIGIALSCFSIGLTVGKMLTSRQEQAKNRNNECDNGND